MKSVFATLLLVSQVSGIRNNFLSKDKVVEVQNSEQSDMNWTLKSIAESEKQLKIHYDGK